MPEAKRVKEKTADKWIPVQSVAETLGCTDRYVHMLIENGDLKAMKLGERALRVSERSLQNFVDSRVINPQDYYAPEEPTSPDPKKPKIAKSHWMDR